jgi:hypothetical protein
MNHGTGLEPGKRFETRQVFGNHVTGLEPGYYRFGTRNERISYSIIPEVFQDIDPNKLLLVSIEGERSTLVLSKVNDDEHGTAFFHHLQCYSKFSIGRRGC